MGHRARILLPKAPAAATSQEETTTLGPTENGLQDSYLRYKKGILLSLWPERTIGPMLHPPNNTTDYAVLKHSRIRRKRRERRDITNNEKPIVSTLLCLPANASRPRVDDECAGI